MSKELTQDKALIFRIVHKGNMPGVWADGCRCRHSARGGAYKEIGNPELIVKRQDREVPCGPMGTLSHYVPFYFTPFSPMLYNIKTGYNGITKRSMSEIVLLVSSLRKLVTEKIQFVFTDRHAYLKTALFSDDIADLSRIDWAALQARNFKRDNLERFEKYQAEALIYQHVPLRALLGVVCYDEESKSELQAMSAANGTGIRIITRPGWYL